MEHSRHGAGSPARALICSIFFLALGPALEAQVLGVSMKPSNRPWTLHPFQMCRDSLYSTYQSSPARLELIVQELKQAGVSMARFELPWLNIEARTDGDYDWAMTDRIMGMFERYEIEPLPILLSCPLTAGSGLTAKMHPACAPDLIDFALAYLERYQGRVQYIEIGNEPNQIYFVEDFGWGRVHARFFSEILVPVSVAIKTAYPSMKILNGGEFRELPEFIFHRMDIPSLGRQEVPLDHIDVFSVHYVNQISEMAAMRSRLDAAGYAHVPIWLTECDYYDDWAQLSDGFTRLVRDAYPNYVQGFFDYTDFNGHQYHVDQSTGYRFHRYDDGGIMGYDLDRAQVSYTDFINVTGGPFPINLWAPLQGVSFSSFLVKEADPGASWSVDLPLVNLGSQAHRVELRYSGSAASGPSQLDLPAERGRSSLHLSGVFPQSGSERLMVLARSKRDGRFADMNRVLLRGDKGQRLNVSMSYDSRYAALFDGDEMTTQVLAGRPEVIQLSWSHPVRIEQIEILTAAGDLVDTASSYIDLEFWDGSQPVRLGSFFAREGREAGGPFAFRIVEDGESIPALPFNTDQIYLRVWHKTRIASIEVLGNPDPGNSPIRCELTITEHADPSSGSLQSNWEVEGWVYDPDGLARDCIGAELELNGRGDLLSHLQHLQNALGPLPFFNAGLVSSTTYHFRFQNCNLLDRDRHSWVLRVRDKQGRGDMSLVNVDPR